MTGQESLAKWLKGWDSDKTILKSFLESQEAFRYDGIIYRGLASKNEIQVLDTDMCSWSTSRDVAENFASFGRYQKILRKKSSGYSIKKIRAFLIENHLMEDCLKSCSGAFEEEVIDSCFFGEYRVIKSF